MPSAFEDAERPVATPIDMIGSSPKDRAMAAASESTFPRCARLIAKVQFDAAFADGRRCASRFFRASVGNPSHNGVSLGLAVSRRVSKLAVQRNRLKRSVRESFRHRRATLPALDIVITAKPEAVMADAEALRQDLAKLWIRITALKPPEHSGTMRGAS